MIQPNPDDANSGALPCVPTAVLNDPYLKLVTDADEPSTDSVQPLATAATRSMWLQTPQAFTPRRIAEILATLGNRIEPDWIVAGYIGPGLVTILAAKPKVGKSTLAASLVTAAKDGGHWLGYRVRKCRTLWLDLEMGEPLTARTLQRAGLKEGDVWAWSGQRDGFDLDELRAFVEREKIDLLVIDSWSKFALVEDENNNAKLTKELNTVVRIARELNVAILLIHHHKKSTDSGIDDLRGAGAIGADADIILNLYPIGKAAQDPRRKILGFGRFMDVTPPEIQITYREGRYVLGKSGSARPKLPKCRQQALDALACANGPLTFSQWETASGLKESTFKNVRVELLTGEYVRVTEADRYVPTELGLATARPKDVQAEPKLEMVAIGPTIQSP